MVRLVVLLAVLLAGGGAAPAAAQDASQGIDRYPPPARHITCESWQFKRATCSADTRGGVRLVQQTGGICTRGATWGFTPRGIWVNNGCRAIFAAVGGARSNVRGRVSSDRPQP